MLDHTISMPVGREVVMEEGSVSSSPSAIVESNIASVDTLLAEEIAWADSCLIRDPELAESDWSSMRDALLEIFCSQSSDLLPKVAFDNGILPFVEEVKISAGRGKNDVAVSDDDSHMMVTRRDFSNGNMPGIFSFRSDSETRTGFPEEIDSEMVPSSSEEAEENLQNPEISNETLAWYDSCLIRYPELSQEDNWNFTKNDLLDIFSSKPADDNNVESILSSSIEKPRRNISVNAFLPGYNEEEFREENNNTEMEDVVDDFGFQTKKPLTDDIFRLWDLDLATEEDEFMKQLNKALVVEGGGGVAPTSSSSSPFDDSNKEEESLYGLISAIADSSEMLKQDWNEEEALDGLISGIADLSMEQNHHF